MAIIKQNGDESDDAFEPVQRRSPEEIRKESARIAGRRAELQRRLSRPQSRALQFRCSAEEDDGGSATEDEGDSATEKNEGDSTTEEDEGGSATEKDERGSATEKDEGGSATEKDKGDSTTEDESSAPNANRPRGTKRHLPWLQNDPGKNSRIENQSGGKRKRAQDVEEQPSKKQKDEKEGRVPIARELLESFYVWDSG